MNPISAEKIRRVVDALSNAQNTDSEKDEFVTDVAVLIVVMSSSFLAINDSILKGHPDGVDKIAESFCSMIHCALKEEILRMAAKKVVD